MRGRGRGRGGKRNNRNWDTRNPDTKRSRVLYQSSWLDDPWRTLENGGVVILYDCSWLDDPWRYLASPVTPESTDMVERTQL